MRVEAVVGKRTNGPCDVYAGGLVILVYHLLPALVSWRGVAEQRGRVSFVMYLWGGLGCENGNEVFGQQNSSGSRECEDSFEFGAWCCSP